MIIVKFCENENEHVVVLEAEVLRDFGHAVELVFLS